jgi:DNA-binding NtrC family response regulator
MIGTSEAIRGIVETIIQIAPTQINVLITGESGSGKEVVARAVHSESTRSEEPFFALNVSALNEGILESELFGHEKGAFTDAVHEREGLFEAAGGGTVFLDEIGDISKPTQVRLLRVLEEREYTPVGGNTARTTEARVIAATNRDLEEAVEHDEFREDVYWRLKGFEIHIPPLRERKEDIPQLIDHFVEQFCIRHNRTVPTIDMAVADEFVRYDWPGNIRELRNVVEGMLALSDGDIVGVDALPASFTGNANARNRLPATLPRDGETSDWRLLFRALLELKTEVQDLRGEVARLSEGRWAGSAPRVERETFDHFGVPVDAEMVELSPNPPDRDGVATDGSENRYGAPFTVKEMESRLIQQTLKDVSGNRRKAAERLGMGERTLYRKLKEYGLRG